MSLAETAGSEGSVYYRSAPRVRMARDDTRPPEPDSVGVATTCQCPSATACQSATRAVRAHADVCLSAEHFDQFRRATVFQRHSLGRSARTNSITRPLVLGLSATFFHFPATMW